MVLLYSEDCMNDLLGVKVAASYLHVTFVSAQTNTQEYEMDHRRANPARVGVFFFFFLPTFKLKSTPVLSQNVQMRWKKKKEKKETKKKIPPPRL